MNLTKKNPRIDAYLDKQKNWKPETAELRKIVLSCGLSEELKWGVPCYTHEGKNVIIIHGFKAYVALLFFNGALLKDPHGLLFQQTANVQAGRQIRFKDISEIIEKASILRSYIKEAVEVEKAGRKVVMKKTSEYNIPEEFSKKLKEDPRLKKAFESLTPGRQRGYILYFSQPKQAKTRETRIEKYMKQILKGKGLQD